MKYLLFISVVVLLLTQCGEYNRQEPCILRGEHCDRADKRQSESTSSHGEQGDIGPEGPQGPAGDRGISGETGDPGENGSSCSVTQAVNGALITCTDGSQVLILNGVNGQDGADGLDATPSPYTITSIVDPCGDAAGIYDEVFFRLADNRLIASFSDNSNGLNTRFSVLTTGNYMTTDGSHCFFSVDVNNQIYNEHY